MAGGRMQPETVRFLVQVHDGEGAAEGGGVKSCREVGGVEDPKGVWENEVIASISQASRSSWADCSFNCPASFFAPPCHCPFCATADRHSHELHAALCTAVGDGKNAFSLLLRFLLPLRYDDCPSSATTSLTIARPRDRRQRQRSMETPQRPPDALALNALAARNALASQDLFGPAATRETADGGGQTLDDARAEADLKLRFRTEYTAIEALPASVAAKLPARKTARAGAGNALSGPVSATGPARQTSTTKTQKLIEGPLGSTSTALTQNGAGPAPGIETSLTTRGPRTLQPLKPEWHPPWKLMRVISGHLGWVRSLAVEPGNKWFASGAGDRTIKIWDLATGSLRLTLTGHISTVRGLAVSPRHPYLFSCGEDKMVKCWDLETNKVIRHYHGHLSGVYTLSLHPTLDVLVTGGRDGVARVWDMRTRSNIHVLSGHTQTVSDVKCQEADPQVITASLDSTVRMWDLAAGKTLGVLTHHKKGVRALALHPSEFTFASGSTGSIKQWKCPEGAFMQNFEGHNAIINTLSVNQENVFFSGGMSAHQSPFYPSKTNANHDPDTTLPLAGDNGSMSFWDWKSGYRFQALDTTAQPGSLDAEAGIMTSTFDRSGLRLICGEADKTSKPICSRQIYSHFLLLLHQTDADGALQSKFGSLMTRPRLRRIRYSGRRRCPVAGSRRLQTFYYGYRWRAKIRRPG